MFPLHCGVSLKYDSNDPTFRIHNNINCALFSVAILLLSIFCLPVTVWCQKQYSGKGTMTSRTIEIQASPNSETGITTDNMPVSSIQETLWKTWGDAGGNGGVTFTSIHPSSGHIFTSSDMSRSLFRSKDRAETWEAIANPITGTADYIAGDPKEPLTLYMSQVGVTPKGSGIWKSTDDGDTWIQIFQSTLFGKNDCHSGIVDPQNAKILYWTGGDKGIMRSQDGGYSWQDWSQGLPKDKLKYEYHFAHTIELDQNTPLEQRRLFYPTNLGLYYVVSSTGQWKLMDGLPKGTCSDVEVCNNNIIYAAFPEFGLYITRNGGKSWEKKTTGIQNKKIVRVVATNDRPDIVYLSTDGDIGESGTMAIYGSRDYANSFTILTNSRFNADMNWKVNYRQEEGVSVRELFVDPNDPLSVYVIRGMKSTDGGRTWKHFGMKEISQDRWQGTGLPLLTQYRVVFDPNRKNIVWLGYSDTGLMLSEDGGNTVINAPTYHRGEVNQAAYLRDKLVRSSGSSTSMAVDPDLSSTVYASISGKSIESRAAGGGIVIKTVDQGWNWTPIYEKNGLDDGIVRSIIIDPSSPIHDRTIYVASFGNGVYKSTNDGNTFKNVTPHSIFNGNTRVMWLEMAPSDPKRLYLGVGGSDGIRPIYFGGPGGYTAIQPGMYGGIYKTSDGGATWEKCNKSREIPSVQDVAVDPTNADIVYAAAYSEDYLVPANAGHPEWKDGGIFKSIDGGATWEKVFASPVEPLKGKGQVQGICINPVAPGILYAVVENYGVYATYNAGKTWELLGKASMDRMQRRFHSIDINPHDPSELWIAHFGTGFSKGIDYQARKIMERKFLNANFIKNSGFEEKDSSNSPKYWKIEEPPVPQNEKPVVSVTGTVVKSGNFSLRFNLTKAYPDAPSTIPGQREQARLEKEGVLPSDDVRRKEGETASWVYQKIDPYFTSLMRGKEVAIEMDVFIAKGSTSRPQIYLSEARDYNVHWVVAETYLEDLEPLVGKPASEMKGQWYHVRSIGTVTKGANWLRVTISGVAPDSNPIEAYVDNVRLSLVN
jgi:photosystem II stability/assembly factor-like uncharacterized protein